MIGFIDIVVRTMKKLFSIVLIVIISLHSNAQKIQFSIGKNLSQYHLINTQGNPFNGLQTLSGSSVSLGFQNQFLDTLVLQKKNAEKALVYTRNRNWASFLSHLTYSFGLNMFQMNNIGVVQQIPLRYETDFVGLEGGIGFRIQFKNLFTLYGTGLLSGNKMLSGIQNSGSAVYDLRTNNQFNNIKWMGGLEGRIEKKISSAISIHVLYKTHSTLSSTLADTGNLEFSNQQYSIGISFHIH